MSDLALLEELEEMESGPRKSPAERGQELLAEVKAKKLLAIQHKKAADIPSAKAFLSESKEAQAQYDELLARHPEIA